MSYLRFDLPRHFRAPVDIADSEWLFNQAKSQAGQELFVIAMTQGKRHGTWLEIGCGDPIRSNNTYLLEKRFGWTGVSIDLETMDDDIVTPFEEYWPGYYKTITKPSWPDTAPGLQELSSLPDLESQDSFKNFMEKQISDIDLISKDQRRWHTARSGAEFHQADALTFDYTRVPSVCDYLQIDIDPSSHNLAMLEILIPSHSFSVITFEHDAWDRSASSAWVRDQSRRHLAAHGYQMVINDVTVPPGHGNGIGDEPINFEDWWIHPDRVPRSVWQCYQNLDSDGTPKYYYSTLFDA